MSVVVGVMVGMLTLWAGGPWIDIRSPLVGEIVGMLTLWAGGPGIDTRSLLMQ